MTFDEWLAERDGVRHDRLAAEFPEVPRTRLVGWLSAAYEAGYAAGYDKAADEAAELDAGESL